MEGFLDLRLPCHAVCTHAALPLSHRYLHDSIPSSTIKARRIIDLALIPGMGGCCCAPRDFESATLAEEKMLFRRGDLHILGSQRLYSVGRYVRCNILNGSLPLLVSIALLFLRLLYCPSSRLLIYHTKSLVGSKSVCDIPLPSHANLSSLYLTSQSSARISRSAFV